MHAVLTTKKAYSILGAMCPQDQDFDRCTFMIWEKADYASPELPQPPWRQVRGMRKELTINYFTQGCQIL